MRFDAPLWLAALAVLLPVGVVALARLERRRRAALARWGDPALLARTSSLGSPGRRVASHALRLAAAAFLLVALARPQWGASSEMLHHDAHDVLFLLDLSRSMNAADASPSRLEAAKDAARAIADSLPNDRVGLEVFGGAAFLQLPLTLDHEAFARFLDAAGMEQIPDAATDFEDAASVAAETYARDGGPGAHVAILLTDGEDTEGKLGNAVRFLAQGKVRTFTVGVGTPEGAVVPQSATDPTPHRDALGNVVVSRLMPDNLRDIAVGTGGAYVRWSGAASVAPIVGAIRALAAADARSRHTTLYADRFAWPLALALLALLADALMDAPRIGRRRVPSGAAARLAAAVVVALGLIASTGAQAGGSPRDAASLYRAGRFREAYDAFKAIADDPAMRRHPDRSALASYDAGNALYRLARFSDALTRYRAALVGPRAVRARAYFNLGDVYMHVADGASNKKPALGAAINAYEDALALDPGDVDAKWNLELALRRLEDEQTRFGKGPHRRGDWGGGNLTKSGYAGAPQGGAGATQGGGYGAGDQGEAAQQITQTEARRMLDQIERALVTGQLGAPPPRGAGTTSRERDW